MYLISMKTIQETVGARDLADTFGLLRLANTETSTYLSSLLRTSFAQASGVTDYFFIDENRLGPVMPYFQLSLNNGFIDEDTTPVEVKVAESIPALAAATALDPDFFKVDKNKGLVTIFIGDENPYPRGYYMSVTYDHGFAAAEDTEYQHAITYVFEGIPQWLQDVALSYSVEIYRLQKEWDKQPEKLVKATAPTTKQSLKRYIEVMVTNHLRFFPYAFPALEM